VVNNLWQANQIGFSIEAALDRVRVFTAISGSKMKTGAETAKRLRERIGGDSRIEGMDNPSAAATCDVAILTVPFSGVSALLKQLKSVWKPGTMVIDTTVPLAAAVGGRATRLLGVWEGSCAQAAQAMLPAARVVSDDSAVPRGGPIRPVKTVSFRSAVTTENLSPAAPSRKAAFGAPG